MNAVSLDVWLGQLLQQHRPRSLLSCSRAILPVLKDWGEVAGNVLCTITTVTQLASLAERRFDLALIIDQLGTVEHRQAEQILAYLRDFHSHCFYVLETGKSAPMPWSPSDFYALGLERLRETAQPGEVYRYDTRRYNPKRRWNNAEHWANPERFNLPLG